jgi:Holliday junction resolvase RusA-like endonuclease
MEHQLCEFVVRGKPQPKGSMRMVVPRGFTRAMLTSDNPRLSAWERIVSVAARKAMGARHPSLLAIGVDLRFYLPRPKAHYRLGRYADELRPHAPKLPTAQRDDVDKLARGVLDALTDIVWRDDGQVAELTARKAFADGTDVGVVILVWEIWP